MDQWSKLLETPVTYLTAAVASLSTVVGILWKRLEKKETQIETLSTKIDNLHEKRVKDLREIARLDD